VSTVKDKQDRAAQLREEMLQVIAGLDLETLATAAKHEYDDEAVVPPEGSPGAILLRDGRDQLVDFVRQTGRFPESGIDMADAGATWHHADSLPSQRAQAFVDLGLFFSYHAVHTGTAELPGLYKALDSAAEQLTFTLVSDYGPIV
jgi:hypothetical protein